jgi:hypothetical protein
MQTENRKRRDDLAPEEWEGAEPIGRLDYKSPRNPFKYRSNEMVHFIPSWEQH